MLKNRRIDRVLRYTVLAMLATVLIAPKTFADQSGFPCVPLISGFQIPFPFDMVLFIAWIMVMGMMLLRPGKAVWLIISALIYTVFVLADINRLMPYFLFYFLFLILRRGYASYLPPHYERQLWQIWRLAITGMYLWSGLLKINPQFSEGFLARIAELLPGSLGAIESYSFVGYLPAILECLFAIGLIFKPSRRFAVLGLSLMHLTILLWLGPFGINWNRTVWPWNLYMIAILNLVFIKELPGVVRGKLPVIKSARGSVVLLLFWLLPGLSIFNLYDHYLSWSLYSFRTPSAHYYIDVSCAGKLGGLKSESLVTNDEGKTFIDPYQWAYRARGSLIYPQQWVFEEIGKNLEKHLPEGCGIERQDL